MSAKPPGHVRDTLAVTALAAAARAAVALWAGARFPAAADGTYYHTVAQRIAQGHGYTWLWPDGAVTYAAHYPVGYPALLAPAYLALGPSVAVASAVNALVGTAAAAAAHRLALRQSSRPAALAAACLVALHPALLLYTPALMTEGVVASLLVVAALVAQRASECTGAPRARSLALLGVTLGVTTLVRPQSLALAPLLGALASPLPALLRLRDAALVTAATVATCLPWTIRNCRRMGRCALVSVNGGWNLLIGSAPGATGTWSPIQVPDACKTVWDEAGKDACFGDAARSIILADLPHYLSLVPAKLSATFDYCGAGPWYLHESNREAFTWEQKVFWGSAETVFIRLTLVAALATLGLPAGDRALARRIIAAIGIASALSRHATPAYLALALVALLAPRKSLLFPATAATIAATALTHAVFFGAGRYALVTLPLVTTCALGLLTSPRPRGDS